jgi:hypothetical protein
MGIAISSIELQRKMKPFSLLFLPERKKRSKKSALFTPFLRGCFKFA